MTRGSILRAGAPLLVAVGIVAGATLVLSCGGGGGGAQAADEPCVTVHRMSVTPFTVPAGSAPGVLAQWTFSLPSGTDRVLTSSVSWSVDWTGSAGDETTACSLSLALQGVPGFGGNLIHMTSDRLASGTSPGSFSRRHDGSLGSYGVDSDIPAYPRPPPVYEFTLSSLQVAPDADFTTTSLLIEIVTIEDPEVLEPSPDFVSVPIP